MGLMETMVRFLLMRVSSQSMAQVGGERASLQSSDLGRSAIYHKEGLEDQSTGSLQVCQGEGRGARPSCTDPGLFPNSPTRATRHLPGQPPPNSHPLQRNQKQEPLLSLQGLVQSENKEILVKK